MATNSCRVVSSQASQIWLFRVIATNSRHCEERRLQQARAMTTLQRFPAKVGRAASFQSRQIGG
jgi:hypothetical protein